MPIYTIKCTECDRIEDDVFARMHDSHFCSQCGGVAERVPVLPHTDMKPFQVPIVMHSIGCTSEEQIREMQRAGVTISDDPRDENYGIPIAHTRKEKLKALKVAGYIETTK